MLTELNIDDFLEAAAKVQSCSLSSVLPIKTFKCFCWQILLYNIQIFQQSLPFFFKSQVFKNGHHIFIFFREIVWKDALIFFRQLFRSLEVYFRIVLPRRKTLYSPLFEFTLAFVDVVNVCKKSAL